MENSTSWTLSNVKKLNAGTSYTWWVRAWNSTDEDGPWSEGADFVAGNFHIMSINANAFVPWNSSYNYSYCFAGGCLRPSDNSSPWYSAPVILPDGARVWAVKFYYRNGPGVTTVSTCELRRSAYNSINVSIMATMYADITGGYSSKYETSISNSTIDNINYSYFIMVYLPSTKNDLIHVVIEYFN